MVPVNHVGELLYYNTLHSLNMVVEHPFEMAAVLARINHQNADYLLIELIRSKLARAQVLH